jgi:hypothetical protein
LTSASYLCWQSSISSPTLTERTLA